LEQSMKRFAMLAAVVVLGACERVETGVEPTENGADFTKYVAMGTSISMGYASDGVVAASQQTSWPRLLAADIGVTFTQPLIEAPGCRPPLIAPLSLLKRLDGSLSISNTVVCTANSAGVALPAQNVAVTAQTAVDAFTLAPTPNTVASRVLAAGQTQVNAMRSQNPTFVSVEFGGGEVLPALNGLVSINTTIRSIDDFTSGYQNIIDAVKQTGAKALLVTLPTDVTKVPAVRTSAEIASQRNAFALLNVSVNANCDTSPNQVTFLKLLSVMFTAATRATAGLGPADLSCEDVPGTADGILSPAEVTTLNTLVGQINSYITTKANENGYATMSLGTLYDTAKSGVAFDLAAILASTTPFGPNISLDGVHPSAAGNAILAAAAKAAITAKYGTITK
jgi:hypothetical protein